MRCEPAEEPVGTCQATRRDPPTNKDSSSLGDSETLYQDGAGSSGLGLILKPEAWRILSAAEGNVLRRLRNGRSESRPTRRRKHD